jgi:hypothetical protein
MDSSFRRITSPHKNVFSFDHARLDEVLADFREFVRTVRPA